MNPRRTHESNFVYRLEGGTEDNDLWCMKVQDTSGTHLVCSVWEPSPKERAEIAAGSNIELLVWGDGHPPVAMRTTGIPLGKPPTSNPHGDV